MRGFVKRFAERAEQKLRLSQIKILYQNQHAIEFLAQQLKLVAAIDEGADTSIIEGLDAFNIAVDNGIVSLTYQTILTDRETAEQRQINGALKNLYSGFCEGQRRSRASRGAANGDLLPFATKFSPAAGWKNISDREWDLMVSQALRENNQ